LDRRPGRPVDVAFSPDGQRHRRVRRGVAVWDAATDRRSEAQPAARSRSPGGKLAAVGGRPSFVVYDERTGTVASERWLDASLGAVAAVGRAGSIRRRRADSPR
jgi:hypothetical protein